MYLIIGGDSKIGKSISSDWKKKIFLSMQALEIKVLHQM